MRGAALLGRALACTPSFSSPLSGYSHVAARRGLPLHRAASDSRRGFAAGPDSVWSIGTMMREAMGLTLPPAPPPAPTPLPATPRPKGEAFKVRCPPPAPPATTLVCSLLRSALPHSARHQRARGVDGKLLLGFASLRRCTACSEGRLPRHPPVHRPATLDQRPLGRSKGVHRVGGEALGLALLTGVMRMHKDTAALMGDPSTGQPLRVALTAAANPLERTQSADSPADETPLRFADPRGDLRGGVPHLRGRRGRWRGRGAAARREAARRELVGPHAPHRGGCAGGGPRGRLPGGHAAAGALSELVGPHAPHRGGCASLAATLQQVR
jgi:hypothetical protein